MKKTLLILALTLVSIININAQNSNDYIDEAYSLFKIKSFNTKTNLKKCDIFAYVRVADKFKEASYFIELKPNKIDRVIFRDLLDFNDLSKMVVAKSHRQKEDVYEFNFGEFYISEYASMQIVIRYNDGTTSIIPLDMTDYKNPMTIMN